MPLGSGAFRRIERRRRLCAAIAAPLLLGSSLTAAAPREVAEKCASDSYRGQEERDRGSLLEARGSFRACAADECPGLVRKDCTQWLAEVQENLPTVVLGAADDLGADLLDVRVLVDGVPRQDELATGRALVLDPGPHPFRFEHPPDAPIELTIVLRTGEHNRPIRAVFARKVAAPTMPAPPKAPPPPIARTGPSIATYVVGGIGVLGLASFAYFGLTGLDEKNNLRAQCGTKCTDARIAPLKVDYVAADVSLGVGVVALGIATWLFFHRTAAATTPATALAIAPSAHGAEASLVGSF